LVCRYSRRTSEATFRVSAQPGHTSAKIDARVTAQGIAPINFAACPVVFWDVFGKQGYLVRATVSKMGSLLLSRSLNLNDT